MAIPPDPIKVHIVGDLILTDGSSIHVESYGKGTATALAGKAVITPLFIPGNPVYPPALVTDIAGLTDENSISLSGTFPQSIPGNPVIPNPFSGITFTINADISDESISIISEDERLIGRGIGKVMIKNMEIT